MNFGRETAAIYASLSSGLYSACGKQQSQFDKCRAKASYENSKSGGSSPDLELIYQECFPSLVQFGSCAANLLNEYTTKCPTQYQQYHQCLKSNSNDVIKCDTTRQQFEACVKDKHVSVKLMPPSGMTTVQAQFIEQKINSFGNEAKN